MQNTKLTTIQSMLYPRRYSAAIATTAASFVKKAVRVSGRNCEYTQTDTPKTRAIPIADFDIYINPKQMAVSDKPFNIKVKLVADGIVHEFEIDLGFTNKI